MTYTPINNGESGLVVRNAINNNFSLVDTALNTKENTITAGTTAQYFRGDKTFQTLDKTAVGLNNVDNTSDLNKPISTATQTALNAKQNTITTGTTSQYFRGDFSLATLDKTAVGLSNVANADTTTTANITDSTNKRFITDAQQTVLSNTSGTNTGDNAVNSLYSGLATSKQDTLVSGTNIKTLEGQSLLGSGNIDLTKSDVGLANVDNTSDADKPVSTATQTALNAKENTLNADQKRKVTVSTSAPSGGVDGDIWLQYTP